MVKCMLCKKLSSSERTNHTAPNGKVRGYIDLGTDIKPSDFLVLEKDALVIMAIAVDSNWKLPVGYCLIDGITADVSANIVPQALTRHCNYNENEAHIDSNKLAK